MKRLKLTAPELIAQPAVDATAGEILDHHLAWTWIMTYDDDLGWIRKRVLRALVIVMRWVFTPLARGDEARKAAWPDLYDDEV